MDWIEPRWVFQDEDDSNCGDDESERFSHRRSSESEEDGTMPSRGWSGPGPGSILSLLKPSRSPELIAAITRLTLWSICSSKWSDDFYVSFYFIKLIKLAVYYNFIFMYLISPGVIRYLCTPGVVRYLCILEHSQTFIVFIITSRIALVS